MDDTPKSMDEVVEGEIVSPPATPNDDAGSDAAQVLLSLDELIKSNLQQLDKIQDELKKNREMLSDAFSTNPVYVEQDKKVKEATKVRNITRQEIMKQPQVSLLANKIKDLRLEIKERQTALSDYVQEYQRMTGVNEVEGYDGDVREIVKFARLIKKASKK